MQIQQGPWRPAPAMPDMQAGPAAPALSPQAQHAMASSTQLGVLNPAMLAQTVKKEADPVAAHLLHTEVRARLEPIDQVRFDQAMQAPAGPHANAHAAIATPATPSANALKLDMAQMVLDFTGIVDPTPISDGGNALISLGRGDVGGALMSAAGILPFVGDLAKLGKLPRYAATVEKVLELAKTDKAFAKQIEPALHKLSELIDKTPVDKLPRPAREALQGIKTKIDDALLHKPKLGSYETTVRGQKVVLEGIETRSVNYVKRDRTEYAQLRKQFDSTERGKFAKDLAADPDKVAQLKKAGLDDKAIARLAEGKIPEGYQVHHKLPLDDGGTNSFDNLVLIKNDPYHIGITNAQEKAVGALKPGESAQIDWPIPPGIVYPAQ